MVEVVVFLVGAIVVGAMGVRIGILAAPRIDRWLQRREDAERRAEGDEARHDHD